MSGNKLATCKLLPTTKSGKPEALATMTVMQSRETELPTALELALERVGERWSLLIVEALLEGPRRFNELQDMVGGIAPNILTDRLRRLEREGVVVARPYSE